MRCISINKDRQNNQFSGLKGEFRVLNVEIAPHEEGAKPYYFLKMVGIVSFVKNDEMMALPIIITGSSKGAFFVNKGKNSFYVHRNSILNKTMDRLNILNTSDFVDLCLPVVNNKKGFWIIDTSKL